METILEVTWIPVKNINYIRKQEQQLLKSFFDQYDCKERVCKVATNVISHRFKAYRSLCGRGFAGECRHYLVFPVLTLHGTLNDNTTMHFVERV